MIPFQRDDRGQIAVLAAIVLIGLLFMVALVVDTSFLFTTRRGAQGAADAAALAGATSRSLGGSVPDALAAARVAATRNGFTDTVAGASVTVNIPPVAGSHAGDANYIEAIVGQSVDSVLVPPWGPTSVSARAVAASSSGLRLGILTKGDVDHALSTTGGSTITVNGGNIYVDSSSAKAIGTGSGCISASGTINVVGGAEVGCYSPTPITNAPGLSDPLSGYARPPCPADTSGCTTNLRACKDCEGTVVPGVYTKFSVRSGSTVTMQPGIYIFLGDGLTINGGATLLGTGVLLFNTTSDYPAAGGSCKDINFEGGSLFTLSGPTSGRYKGLLLYQDAACTQDVKISGGGSGTVTTGTLYAPTAEVRLTGRSAVTIDSAIISKSLRVAGGGAFSLNVILSDQAFFNQVNLVD